jgi:hypothetical protein
MATVTINVIREFLELIAVVELLFLMLQTVVHTVTHPWLESPERH